MESGTSKTSVNLGDAGGLPTTAKKVTKQKQKIAKRKSKKKTKKRTVKKKRKQPKRKCKRLLKMKDYGFGTPPVLLEDLEGRNSGSAKATKKPAVLVYKWESQATSPQLAKSYPLLKLLKEESSK